MDVENLKEILVRVQDDRMTLSSALNQLKKLPYEDIGFAKIDHHRSLRTGVPEVIYCEGKSVSQIVGIAKRMEESHFNILGTRVTGAVFEAIHAQFKDCRYYETARIVVFQPRPVKKNRSNCRSMRRNFGYSRCGRSLRNSGNPGEQRGTGI